MHFVAKYDVYISVDGFIFRDGVRVSKMLFCDRIELTWRKQKSNDIHTQNRISFLKQQVQIQKNFISFSPSFFSPLILILILTHISIGR